MKFTQIALLSAVSLAVAERHNHVHRHPARNGSPVQARDPAAVTEIVPGPVVTVYELQGQDISYADVEQGLKDGKYVLIGDDITTVIPATTSVAPTTSSTSTSTTTPAPSKSAEAEFIQQKPSTSTSETPTPSPTPSATPTPKPSTSADSSSSDSSSSSSSSGNTGGEFPSGTIPCSTFPSEYGPVYVDWLGLGGWTGVQNTPGFNGDLSSNDSIVQIETAIAGSGCTKNSFCSYACGAGLQKSQWPKGQGSTGQSIGGLYCNSNGFLELSRTEVSQLCTAGGGGVQVTNNLGQNVAICRTDYPGTEGETVPLNTLPGQTYPLTNPISADYYTWGGAATTAQYYINPAGAALKDACVWSYAGSNMGNWAPVNVGVGVGAGDITYISVFPNAPTNPDGVLDFNIKITGDVSGDCSYSGGKYWSNGAEAVHGCTVAVSSGNTATFVFSS